MLIIDVYGEVVLIIELKVRQETLLDLFIAAQECIPAGNGEGLADFQDYRGADDLRIRRHHQAIIPSYKFDY